MRGDRVDPELFLAIETNDIERAKKRISCSRGLNEKNFYGETPLLLACRRHRFEIIDLLLEVGAEVNTSDQSSRTPWNWICATRNFNENSDLNLIIRVFEKLYPGTGVRANFSQECANLFLMLPTETLLGVLNELLRFLSPVPFFKHSIRKHNQQLFESLSKTTDFEDLETVDRNELLQLASSHWPEVAESFLVKNSTDRHSQVFPIIQQAEHWKQAELLLKHTERSALNASEWEKILELMINAGSKTLEKFLQSQSRYLQSDQLTSALAETKDRRSVQLLMNAGASTELPRDLIEEIAQHRRAEVIDELLRHGIDVYEQKWHNDDQDKQNFQKELAEMSTDQVDEQFFQFAKSGDIDYLMIMLQSGYKPSSAGFSRIVYRTRGLGLSHLNGAINIVAEWERVPDHPLRQWFYASLKELKRSESENSSKK